MSEVSILSILFNDCVGGFRFSEKFLEEFERRTGEVCSNFGGGWRNRNTTMRINPIALEIYQEYGSAWCSGRNSRIRCYNIPAIFADSWIIEEYHGHETVVVDMNLAYANALDRFINGGRNERALDQEYEAIKEAEQILLRLNHYRS
jgi:hypothetical protein